MDIDIALFLIQDGLINAAIYAVLALCLVLIFTVTRIIYVPQGEFVSFGALTLASMQQGQFPATIYVLLALGLLAAAYEIGGAVKARTVPALSRLLFYLVYPGLLWLGVKASGLTVIGAAGQIALTFLIIAPMGPMLYRVVFQPLADTPVLILLIAAVATHLVLVGIGLLVFGPEGSRTTPLSDLSITIGPLSVSGQSLLIAGLSVALMIAFAWAFSSTLMGKALRATAINRVGARLVGIRPQMAGQICFLIAACIGTLAGVLISPLTTIYYDSGFLIALKGFVAAIIGGLTGYTMAVSGAVFVGVLEAFASFWTSAYREVIVFVVIIPVLLARSLGSSHVAEDEP
jgi:branched-chain amino acid transport system permease protein